MMADSHERICKYDQAPNFADFWLVIDGHSFSVVSFASAMDSIEEAYPRISLSEGPLYQIGVGTVPIAYAFFFLCRSPDYAPGDLSGHQEPS